MLAHIGLDDTDSRFGGCTTYTAYRIVRKLVGRGIKLLDYPRLLRLNPNVPWKTRGNAALGLTADVSSLEDLVDLVYGEVSAASDKNHSYPSFVIIAEQERKELYNHFSQAIYRILEPSLVAKVLEKHRIIYGCFNRRIGLIGSFAAATNLLEWGDHTFELLTYRRPEYIGTERLIDPDSVKKMDALYHNWTFNNVDEERILISPHGDDPVLFGIRGEDPMRLLDASKMVRGETPLGGMIFKTNQATDMHYKECDSLSQILLGDSIKIKLKVMQSPIVTLGGHVFVRLTDGVDSITAAFYWESGDMRKAASLLMPGDQVTVCGGVKVSANPVINVEKLIINQLKITYIERNPVCPNCLSTGESVGRNKGYRCKKCKTILKQQKTTLVRNRPLVPGLYLPPLRYFRHLMKPLKRYGKEKVGYHFNQNTFKLFF